MGMECCKLLCMELNSIGTLQNTNSSVVGKGGSSKVVSLGSSASSMMQQVSSKESDAVGFFSFTASDPSFISSCFSMNSRVVQRHRFYFPPFPELACASCFMENYTS
ncbi:hypothetical protein CUMW_060550 [Citrus unshiu]|uniref:Uncharacterized protein n=1 Tax=Citrus unshiu TaxID=55188 RepID=A0A2H5NNF1_CITUN|nr:hypothetical protein CUMW_060550 [Citrus unshiu]